MLLGTWSINATISTFLKCAAARTAIAALTGLTICATACKAFGASNKTIEETSETINVIRIRLLVHIEAKEAGLAVTAVGHRRKPRQPSSRSNDQHATKWKLNPS
jgi:hypothetical protein